MRVPGRAWAWLLTGQWRRAPVRTGVAIAAVAVGVALALAIHLVNASALAEFGRALATINGEAMAQLQPRSGALDDRLYARVIEVAAQSQPHPGAVQASPVLEIRLPARSSQTSGTVLESLRVLALDPMAAARVSPTLLPRAEGDPGSQSPLFEADAIFLSAAALERLDLRVGDPLLLGRTAAPVALRVAGTVPGAAAGQILAVMDLGTAQWRFERLGSLSRIDLRWDDGVDARALQARLHALLGNAVLWTAPEAGLARMSNLSRAYRVNLTVLAAVALFTGAFLVFSSMALASVRQQRELALLAVLGASRRVRIGALLAQGGAIGVVGSALGTAAGIGLALLLLGTVGGDLGGGYFSGSRPQIHLDPVTLAAFFALGVGLALAGSALPAWAAARHEAARILKSGPQGDLLEPRGLGRVSLMLALAGAGLLALPPIGGLPLAAYAAIAAWLLAGIAATPVLAQAIVAALMAMGEARLWRQPALWLAAWRLRSASATVAAGLSGVVAAVALSAAMAIMVTSFRASVSDWLDQVLPADLYLRAPSLDEPLRRRLATLAGVERMEWLRTTELLLDPMRPPVAVLSRPVEPDQAQRQLPITGELWPVDPQRVPIWVSEAVVDLYGLAPGSRHELPLGETPVAVQVAGVWRDYARQHGAVVLRQEDYQRITGDTTVSDAALWLSPGVSAESIVRALEAMVQTDPHLVDLEWRSASAIRTLSLSIFDRSFAVTYVLEAIALAVALFGVAAATAGDCLARLREFAVLLHVGASARATRRQLAAESALGSATAVIWGTLIGAAIGLVLIHRVNPQSFHWTMSVHWPFALLLASTLAMVAAGLWASMWAARSVLEEGALQALRMDEP